MIFYHQLAFPEFSHKFWHTSWNFHWYSQWTKGGSRLKNWCMVRVLSFLIRYFSNYYTLHRSDLAARAAPLDPSLWTIRFLSGKIKITLWRSSNKERCVSIPTKNKKTLYPFFSVSSDFLDMCLKFRMR